MEATVVYYFGDRPSFSAKAQTATMRVSDQEVSVGETRIPYSTMSLCETRMLDGIGTTIRIESDQPPLTIMVPRAVLFRRLVIINHLRTFEMHQIISQALSRFQQLAGLTN